ncbi:TIM barrel protein [Streptomyces malaysiensis]
MPRFAANLSMMYTEHDFLDRFAAASADGFEAVEYLFPYPYDATELRRRLDDHGLRQVLFNAPPGAWESGERGLAALPGREAELRSGIDRALEYAAELGCPRVHVMAGLVGPAGATPAEPPSRLRRPSTVTPTWPTSAGPRSGPPRRAWTS